MAKRKKVADDLIIAEDNKNFIEEVESKTVVDTPKARDHTNPTAPLMFMLSSVADNMTPWGSSVARRDGELREFVPTEPVLSSAVYSTSVRNASFEWEIVPADPFKPIPKNTIKASTRILKNSDRGGGWQKFMLKICNDLYTQDNGAFIEVIRAKDDPNSPVLNIAHLDAGKCTRTGDPEVPVLYLDRLGKYHALKWYQVMTVEEFPSSIETMFGAQLCAVSRALRAAQILRDIQVYKLEKVSGRWARSIELVGGISRSEIEDAFKVATAEWDNAGLTRFNPHVIIPGIDPTNPVSHETIELASLPDQFSFDDEMKWYVAILAMAFGVDYQEFAPLPAGGLGSGQQSEILHLKTRGKGPAMIMSLFENLLNGDNRILPKTVKFQFKVHDARAEEANAQARFMRGKDRSLRVQSGELDIVAARQMAIDDGDLSERIANEMDDRGVDIDGNESVEGAGIPQMGEGDETMTADQIESGIESANERKAFIEGGLAGLPDTNLPSVTEEDVEKEKKELGRYLLGETNG